MKTIIYKNENLRCRVESIPNNKIRLQLQERYLCIFWKNCFQFIEVSEGFWGESERLPMLKLSYTGGGKSEVYKTGTLNLKNRIEQLFQEYFDRIDSTIKKRNFIHSQIESINENGFQR